MDGTPQRRNLLAISVVLIVYNLGGGHLKGEASSFFGSAYFDRPVVLLIAAWALFAYFLWQFWLSLQNYDRFRAHWTGKIVGGETFTQPVIAYLKDRPELFRHSKIPHDLERAVRQSSRRLRYGFGGVKVTLHSVPGAVRERIEVPITSWRVFWHTFGAMCRSSIDGATYSQVLLPYHVAFLAVIVGVARWIL